MPLKVTSFNRIDIIGELWQPGFTAADSKIISNEQVKEIGELNHPNLLIWAKKNCGDFCRIIDVQADFADTLLEWEDDDSARIFFECFYGKEKENV